MTRHLFCYPVVLLTWLAIALGDEATALGGVITGESNAFGVSVDLGLVEDSASSSLLLNASVGPTPTAIGSAPAPYDHSDSAASASASGALDVGGIVGVTEIVDFDTGILEVAAQSDVTGSGGPRTTAAQATVNDVTFDVTSVSSLLSLSSFFTLDATQIASAADVSGGFGTLTPSGMTTITGTHGTAGNQAALTVLGVEFLLDSNPAPNTMFTIDSSAHTDLASLQGSIDVILNEQSLSGDISNSQSILVNGLHLRFNNVLAGLGDTSGLLNGDVIVSHSEAAQQAVPEPGSMSLLACGMAGLAGFAGWRRKGCRRGAARQK
jgi:hypothetical protein